MKTKLLLLFFLCSFIVKSQTNLVPNGDFEIWTDHSQPEDWYRYSLGETIESNNAQNGAKSVNMKIYEGNFNFINTKLFPVVANKTYRITMYHKLLSGTFTSLDFSLYHQPSVFKEEIAKKTEVVFSSTEWTKIEFDYTATVSEDVEVDVWTNGTLNSEILIDNVSMVDVAEIGAQYTLIPDAKFEAKLIALGHDDIADGKVLTSKINTLTSLNVSSNSISDLTGIQDFVALQNLNCGANNLTTLDVTKNTALTKLEVFSNQLTTIDVSKNINLTYLNLSANELSGIDLSKNIAIINLGLAINKISVIDLSKNTALNYLALNQNLLTDLDISNNIKLTDLYCFKNNLISLNTNQNIDLKLIDCQENQLNSLDVSKNILLKKLYCEKNKITSLDFSNNQMLDYLSCNKNILTYLNLPNNPLLNQLSCQDNKLTTVDVSSLTALEYLFCSLNLIESLDVTKNTKLLILDASHNNLQGIDTSKNLLLTSFTINNNTQMTSLDVTKNTLLKSLTCGSSNLTSLDLSNNTEIQTLYVIYCKIPLLDLSKNSKLTNLYCYNNDLLTTINLKNGNNSKSNTSSLLLNNVTLKCIQVDDVNYSNSNWSSLKDASVSYNEDCTTFLGLTDVDYTKASVYPNPTKGEVTISNVTLDKATVYNSVGQLVRTFTLDSANTNNTIDLSGLAKGVYYIYLINQDAASAKKVIVE